MKLDNVVKICLSGLLLALVIIFTRFLSFQNIPIIPFVRISLGPALIIFASIVLGPIYGGIVGGLSDILGILLVPNALGYSINPYFTLVYTLLGVIPWCLFKLFSLIKKENILFWIFNSFLLGLWIFITVFILLNPSVANVNFELYQRILIIVISFVLLSLTGFLVYFINKRFKNRGDVSVMNVAFVSLISEIFIMLILNTIVKSIFFEIDFFVIFFFQAIVFFIDVPLNTFVVSYLIKILNQVSFKGRKYE